VWSFHESTPSEKRLAQALKKAGIRYQREVAVKEFTVDFLISGWLILEVDGESHLTSDRIEKDAKRQRRLEDMGFTVIRIPAMELSRNGIKNWVQRIKHMVNAGPPGLSQEKFENKHYKRQIEKARREIREKALKMGQVARRKRRMLAYGTGWGKREPSCETETMEDYFGKKGEDFAALLEPYDWEKMPSKDEPEFVEKKKRKKRRTGK